MGLMSSNFSDTESLPHFSPPQPPSHPVDFNTVQVTNMAQLHSFVSEDCHKSYFTLRGKLSSDGSTQGGRLGGCYRNVIAILDVSYVHCNHDVSYVHCNHDWSESQGSPISKYLTVIPTCSVL